MTLQQVSTSIVVAAPLFLAACSLGNREGPLVTCADLGNGLKNACAEGIIATCSAPGEVTFHVCSDENACDADWQAVGQYRCNQMDPMPTLRDQSTGATGPKPTGGSAVCGFSYSKAGCASCIKSKCCSEATACSGDEQCVSCLTRPASAAPCAPGLVANYETVAVCTGVNCASECGDATAEVDPASAAGTGAATGGSGGSTTTGGTGGSAGSSTTGGSGGTGGQGTDGGTPACGVSEVCVIATTDSAWQEILAVALDTENIYFADECHVSMVPRLGGFSTALLAPSGCSNLNGTVSLAVDAYHVYWGVDQFGDIKFMRVPVGGGQGETIDTDFAKGLTVDDSAVYWGATGAIKRYDKQNGAITLLANGSYATLSNPYGGLWSSATNLYWVTSDGMGIAKLPKTAAETDAPATVPVTDAHELAVSGPEVFFIGNSIIGKLDAGGSVQMLISMLSQARHMAVTASTIYWVDDEGLRSRSKVGGMARLRKAGVSDGPIAADDEFVFFVDGKDVYRAPK